MTVRLIRYVKNNLLSSRDFQSATHILGLMVDWKHLR
ncbi:MAG: hypothetical protein CM15mP62_12820 [Rhodospirillaceae bacterium]|nr:MAG: hypothetical protein CM15mP62_12820 [Rhodospirillaceae bacterium]